MSKSHQRSKRYQAADAGIDHEKNYTLDEGVKALRETSTTKFDQSVDVAINIKLKKNESVRNTLTLPHSFGDEKRVVVFAKGEQVREAQDAQADFVGCQELIDKIKGGWLEFDAAVATPECMREVAVLGPILGRRGLMPNPKSGTVTMEVGATIKELRAGRSEFHVDKGGTVHVRIGKASMEDTQIKENCQTLFASVMKSLPDTAKGDAIKSVYLSLSMGPSVRLAVASIGEDGV